MEWLKNNASVLVLGILLLIYIGFNETKELEKPSDIILNLDSLKSEIQRENRLIIDSAIKIERRSIDSLKRENAKSKIRYANFKKDFDNVSNIIGELPNF